MVILDTNIIIDHLRLRSTKKISVLRIIEKKYSYQALGLSLISVQELYEGTSTRKSPEDQALLSIISPLTILSYTYTISQYAGKIARDLNRPIELADAAIAATAILHNSPLYTLNAKDFRGIKELEIGEL